MKEYLRTEHNIIDLGEFRRFGTLSEQSVEDAIKDLFRDEYKRYFDCGYGYFQDKVIVNCYYQNMVYRVTMFAKVKKASVEKEIKVYWVDALEFIIVKQTNIPDAKTK